jgi:hypothetical protein
MLRSHRDVIFKFSDDRRLIDGALFSKSQLRGPFASLFVSTLHNLRIFNTMGKSWKEEEKKKKGGGGEGGYRI